MYRNLQTYLIEQKTQGPAVYDMRDPNNANTNFEESANKEVERLRRSIPKGQSLEMNDLSNPKPDPYARLCIENSCNL